MFCRAVLLVCGLSWWEAARTPAASPVTMTPTPTTASCDKRLIWAIVDNKPDLALSDKIRGRSQYS